MSRAGFTLLEMLVVLALLAMAVTMLSFGLRAEAGDRQLLETAAIDMAAAMRRTRLEAMRDNEDRVFALDMDKRRYGSRIIDARIGLAIMTAREKRVHGPTGRIRFTPTGQSSGGTITLSLDDAVFAVKADWLTGRIAVEKTK
jgi:general secretion pathway protein H